MFPPPATARCQSPIGRLTLTADEHQLLGLRIARGGPKDEFGRPDGHLTHPVLACAIEQLERWFSGTLQRFDLPLPPAGTDEAEALRTAIAGIAFGETKTYGALAAEIGSAARAVGQACKTNLFPIIIPCHRVTSTNGREYYSAGEGPRTKTWLIDFEYANLPPERKTRLI